MVFEKRNLFFCKLFFVQIFDVPIFFCEYIFFCLHLKPSTYDWDHSTKPNWCQSVMFLVENYHFANFLQFLYIFCQKTWKPNPDTSLISVIVRRSFQCFLHFVSDFHIVGCVQCISKTLVQNFERLQKSSVFVPGAVQNTFFRSTTVNGSKFRLIFLLVPPINSLRNFTVDVFSWNCRFFN